VIFPAVVGVNIRVKTFDATFVFTTTLKYEKAGCKLKDVFLVDSLSPLLLSVWILVGKAPPGQIGSGEGLLEESTGIDERRSKILGSLDRVWGGKSTNGVLLG
jgi:hypothetical protein